MASLSACALGPNYKAPTPPPGADAPFVSTDQASMSDAALPNDWWRLYDDAQLDQLIAQAFAANEDLKTAEANLAAARDIYEGSRSQLLPQTQVTGSGIYGRDPTFDTILETVGHEPQSTWIFDAMLDASYELDLFGHVRRTIEAARDNAQVVAAERDALRVTIAAETARAYGQICTFGEEIAVASQSLALVTKQQQIEQKSARRGCRLAIRRGTVASPGRAGASDLAAARRAAPRRALRTHRLAWRDAIPRAD